MKKSEFTGRASYSVAMSKDTGCIVMTRTNGKHISVCGSMSREESLNFVKGIMEWSAGVLEQERPRIISPHH